MARGSVIKQKSGSYAIVYRDPTGKQINRVVSRVKKDAEAELTRIVGDIQRGEYRAPKKILFRDLSAKWLTWCESSVRPSTLASYKVQVNKRLNPTFGHLQIHSISVEVIEMYIASLSAPDSGFAPQTVVHTLKALKAILKKGVAWGYLGKSPATDVRRPRIPKKEMDYLNPDEIQALLSATDHRHYPLILTAVMTGMRRAELLGLTWPDIDINGRSIFVRREAYGKKLVDWTKTGHSRRKIGVPKKLIDVLSEHRARQIVEGPPNPLELVFPTAAGTPMLGGNLLRRVFWPTLERAGLRRVRWHDLRHSYATTLLCGNIPITVVQKRLGHSSIQVTCDVYGHVLPASEEAADAALEEAYLKAPIQAQKATA